MANWRVTVQGYQEAQRANIKALEAVKPSGALGRAVQTATLEAQRYSTSVTHVVTGTLRASERVQFEDRNTRGRIYIDPSTVNPRTRQRPVRYGVVEHQRGGDHAFFLRTVNERGHVILQNAAEQLRRELP